MDKIVRRSRWGIIVVMVSVSIQEGFRRFAHLRFSPL